MAFRFTDSHAMSLVAPSLFPGEQVLFRARGVEKPWYSYVFWKFGSFLWKYWLVVGTNQRLIFVQHGGLLSGYSAKHTEAHGWQELDRVHFGWGLFNKDLVVRSQAKRLSRTIIVPRFWMKGNFDAGTRMAQQWNQMRALPPASIPPHALPAY